MKKILFSVLFLTLSIPINEISACPACSTQYNVNKQVSKYFYNECLKNSPSEDPIECDVAYTVDRLTNILDKVSCERTSCQ